MRHAITILLCCFGIAATAQQPSHATSGELCTFVDTQHTEWSVPGVAITMPDTIAIMLGVNQGDEIRMDVRHILQAAIFVRHSEQPGCGAPRLRVEFRVHTYVQ